MKSPAVDAHIAKSAAFARPILTRLRSLMHKAHPQIEETMKWGVPHFEHKGIVAGMAAFKQHAAFGFWSQRLLKVNLRKDAEKLFPKTAELGMGGRKITSLSELPSDALLIRPKRELKKKLPVKPPPYLVAAAREASRDDDRMAR